MNNKEEKIGVLKGFMTSKAQTTLFMVIGLAVVLILGATIYIMNKQTETTINEIPLNIRPVYDYVKSCVEKIGKETIIIMGQQGGYYNIPRDITVEPASYVFQDPGKIIKTPLWYHRGEDRSPTMEGGKEVGVQSEIDTVVKNNLDDCLNNFAGLETYGVKREGNITVQTILSGESVSIKVKLPLALELIEGTPRLDTYDVTIPVRLKGILETARAIQDSENENKQFEDMVMGLISSNPKTPVNNMDFSCDIKKWKVKDVETEIKDMMQYILPRTRIKNTDITPFEDSSTQYKKLDTYSKADVPKISEEELWKNLPADSYDYSHMYLDMGVLSKQPFSVAMQYYPEWGMDIAINPNDGGILKSQTKTNIPKLNFLCVNVYHFAYTMRLLVMITLRDDKAFNGEGYTFNFATPILIKNNRGEREPKPWKSFSGYVEDESFCKDVGDKKVVIRGLGFEEGFGIATPLKDVNVTYECFGRICDLGTTTNEGSGSYQVSRNLPTACSNPTITLEKEGYLPTSEQLDSSQPLLEIQMKEIKKYDLKVKKQQYRSSMPEGYRWGPVEDISKGQNVTIVLDHKDYTKYINYPTDNTIELADGTQTYNLEAYLTTFGRLRGGYTNPEWTVKSTELDGAGTVTITVIEYSPADDEEGIATTLYSEEFREKIKPVIT